MTKHTKFYLIAWTRNVSYLNLKYQKSVTISCDWSIVALVTDRAWCERRIKQISPLKKTLSVLKSPGGNIHCLGYFIAETYRNDQQYLSRVYVVKGNEKSKLLRRGASCALELVKRIDEIPQSIFGKAGLNDCDQVKIELK